MRNASYGRIVFGASAILFGVIGLLWHDADTWQGMHRTLTLPFGLFIGDALMLAQIAGGVMLLYSRDGRLASLVLLVVYGIFALSCAAGIAMAWRTFGVYDGFFEQLALISGALSVYAPSVVSRIGLGLSTVSFTLTQAVYLKPTARLVPHWIPPNQMFWAMLTTVAFGLAAIAILIGIRARLAMRLMSAMITLFGVAVWVPIIVQAPSAHLAWSECLLTFLIAGASWMVSDIQRA